MSCASCHPSAPLHLGTSSSIAGFIWSIFSCIKLNYENCIFFLHSETAIPEDWRLAKLLASLIPGRSDRHRVAYPLDPTICQDQGVIVEWWSL
jgi:hypothetical protein